MGQEILIPDLWAGFKEVEQSQFLQDYRIHDE
jgi:hypothetical protein